MKERPILFNGEMVRAILEGRKTQTRRVVKDCYLMGGPPEDYLLSRCPFGQPGDRLWVRETFFSFRHARVFSTASHIVYRADYSGQQAEDDATECHGWKPSIHMPRWASRISLEITDVRVERLDDISNADCFAEGLPSDTTKGNRTWFSDLWEEINGKGSWAANPWVWVIEFRKLEGGES